MTTDSLSPKQRVFVAEYLVDMNATRAAIAAGYSEATADQQGSRLLKNVKVAAAISAATEKRCKKLEISADRVLQELAKLAFLDPRKLFREDGSLKHIAELDEETAAAVAGIEVEKLYEHFGAGKAKNTGTVTKIKFADKGINLERLGRHLKLFTDRIQVEGLEGIADELRKARMRIQG